MIINNLNQFLFIKQIIENKIHSMLFDVITMMRDSNVDSFSKAQAFFSNIGTTSSTNIDIINDTLIKLAYETANLNTVLNGTFIKNLGRPCLAWIGSQS